MSALYTGFQIDAIVTAGEQVMIPSLLPSIPVFYYSGRMVAGDLII